MVSKTLLPGSEVAFLIFFIPFWLHIGVPEQIKIHPKTRFLQEFASEEAVFLPLSAPVVFNPFSMDFAYFLIENRLQFYRAVAHLGVISYPFKTMRFAGCPACGQCF